MGPYEVLDKLGSGAMGEVFLALDTRLHRRVALKRLTPDASGSDDRRTRVMREARAAARLTHPNIAGVYDVIEHDGHAIIVMEYVEGETLRARLARGRLPIEQVIGIGRQLASALGAAHSHGVVHRDLKPANVQFTPSGTVKVLDFGVATFATPIDTTADARTTRPPTLVSVGGNPGTPVYMAPEQLVASRADVRTDVYSLGVILFEMATGRRPYNESNPIVLALAMANAGAPPADAVDPRVPRELSAVIAKALERDPNARFQSARELEEALVSAEAPASTTEVRAPRRVTPSRGRTIAAVSAVVLVLIGVAAWRPLARKVGLLKPAPSATEPSGPGRARQRTVVAVLPLENLSGDRSNDFLGAGVAETLTMALSKVPTLTVLTRSEVRDALRAARDIRKIAADLGASFVVDGSVQQVAGRLRVTLRLVRPDGTVAWSDAYEDSTTAVFALHRTMAAGIVDKVQGRLPVRADLTIPSTNNVDALTAYWQGRAALDRAVSQADFAEAATSFRRAMALDAGFALGYAGLADTLWQQYQVTHDQTLPRQALEAGLTALKLDPDQPATRVAVATVYHGMGQYDAAVEHVRRALELQPSNDDAHRIFARILSAQEKPEEAIHELQEAIASRPRRWTNYSELGRLYFQLRRLPDAAEALQRALDVRPNDPRTYASLGAIYLEMGDTERALDVLERSNKIAPTGLSLSNTGTAYYRLGRFADAARAYAAALEIDPNSLLTHGNLGDAYLRLKRTDEARREFSKARALALQALSVNDKDARTLARLAAFEAKLGLSNEAVSHAAQAVALGAHDPDIQYKQAVVFALVGNRRQALEALKQALALGIKAAVVTADYDLASLKGSPEFEAIVASHP